MKEIAQAVPEARSARALLLGLLLISIKRTLYSTFGDNLILELRLFRVLLSSTQRQQNQWRSKSGH
jgi:hypothetical protein